MNTIIERINGLSGPEEIECLLVGKKEMMDIRAMAYTPTETSKIRESCVPNKGQSLYAYQLFELDRPHGLIPVYLHDGFANRKALEDMYPELKGRLA